MTVVSSTRERRGDAAHHLALTLATLTAAGKFVRDAVQQRQRALGVDLDDVVVELHAVVDVRFDVDALVVGIETLAPVDLKGFTLTDS